MDQVINQLTKIQNNLHHVHIFASDINVSLKFYQDNFDGRIIFDDEVAGVRNVFMKIGKGCLHFYDQAPKHLGRGSIHHFGIQTDHLSQMFDKLKSNGVPFNKDISDYGYYKYIMVPAPDEILIELFEVDKNKIPKELAPFLQSYFY